MCGNHLMLALRKAQLFSKEISIQIMIYVNTYFNIIMHKMMQSTGRPKINNIIET